MGKGPAEVLTAANVTLFDDLVNSALSSRPSARYDPATRELAYATPATTCRCSAAPTARSELDTDGAALEPDIAFESGGPSSPRRSSSSTDGVVEARPATD